MRPRRLHAPCRLALLTTALALAYSGRARAAEPTGASPPQAPLPASQPAAPPPDQPAGGGPAEGGPPPTPPAEAQPPAQQAAPPERPPAAETPPAPVPPPAVPSPEPTTPPRPDDVFSGRPVPPTAEEQAHEHAWFDSGRSFVGRLFFAPVFKLDRFFSDETDLDPERAQSFARLRGGLKLRQDGRPLWSGDLLAQLYLPGVDRWLDRFRLVLSGVSDNAQEAVTADTATTSPLARRRVDPANLELRFGAYHGIRSSIDLGAGVFFRLPPGAFTRARFRMAIPIDDVMVSRTSYQVFWRTDMLLGTRLTSALEWPVTPSSMVRLGGSAQVAQRKTDGLEYGAELVYSHAFRPTAAVALGTDAVGDSRSPVAFERYRVFARFRHDVLRRWIFVEAEPEVAWPWTPDRGRYQALGVTFRLEVQFEGDGAANGR